MDEYIERGAAMQAAKHAWAKGIEPSQYIEIIPAADVAPVVHGRWIWKENLEMDEYLPFFSHRTVCSCCKCECHGHYDNQEGMTIYEPSNYCPNCGAKMELEDENESDRYCEKD